MDQVQGSVHDHILFKDHEKQRILVENKMNKIVTEKTKGTMVHSQCNTYELFEKPTLYF